MTALTSRLDDDDEAVDVDDDDELDEEEEEEVEEDGEEVDGDALLAFICSFAVLLLFSAVLLFSAPTAPAAAPAICPFKLCIRLELFVSK